MCMDMLRRDVAEGFVCADDGTLFTWGCGALGRLGHGSRETFAKPQVKPHLPTWQSAP